MFWNVSLRILNAVLQTTEYQAVQFQSTVPKFGLQNFPTALNKAESAPNLFNNQTFNVRALELKSWALDRNLDKSQANFF